MLPATSIFSFGLVVPTPNSPSLLRIIFVLTSVCSVTRLELNIPWNIGCPCIAFLNTVYSGTFGKSGCAGIIHAKELDPSQELTITSCRFCSKCIGSRFYKIQHRTRIRINIVGVHSCFIVILKWYRKSERRLSTSYAVPPRITRSLPLRGPAGSVCASIV